MSRAKFLWWLADSGNNESLIETINSYHVNGSNNTVGKTYLQKLDKQFVAWTPLNSEWAQVYTFEKELSPDDDQYESVTSWGLQRYYEVRLPDSKTGTWSGGGIIAASVAQTLDCTLTITFTGTGIKFMSYTDAAAGQYTWSIDGGAYTGSIDLENTVYNGYRLTDIVSGLTYGTYTIVMSIVPGMGNPYAALNNSTSGATDDIFLKCFYIEGSPNPNSCYGWYSSYEYNTKYKLRGGHQWFAFSTKGTADVGANEWIPNHSSIEYASKFANLATDRLLQFQGTGDNKIATITPVYNFAEQGTSVVLTQNFIGVNKDFPSTDLFDIEQTITVDQNGLTVNMRCEALTTIDNSVLYLTMHDQSSYEGTGVGQGYLRYVGLDGVEYHADDHVGKQNLIAGIAPMQAWNGNIIGYDKSGSAFQQSIISATMYSNVNAAFNLLTSARTDKGIDINSVDANTFKIYPFVSQNGGTIASGTVYEWEAKVTMGFVPDAYNSLKSKVGL